MKRIIKTLACLSLAGISLTSCLKNQGPDYSIFYPNATATARHTDSGEFYLQLNGYTRLKPLNMTESPYGSKELRVMLNFTDKGPYSGSSGDFSSVDRNVEVNWIDSIRTKQPVMYDTLEPAVNPAPIEIIDNWMTCYEDGYLTLTFCAYWNNPSIYHSIDLVAGTDPDDPTVFELTHDALKDVPDGNSRRYTGIIAFKVGDLGKFKVKYNSFSGIKTVTFDNLLYTLDNTAATSVDYDRGLAVE